MAGAQDAVKASRSASWALISASSISQRRAIARKAPLAEAVTEVIGPGRGAARWRIGVMGLDFGIAHQPAPRYCPQGALGRGCHRGHWSWPRGSQVADRRHLADDVVERLAQGCWRVDDDGLDCDHGLRSALHGGAARHLQGPD